MTPFKGDPGFGAFSPRGRKRHKKKQQKVRVTLSVSEKTLSETYSTYNKRYTICRRRGDTLRKEGGKQQQCKILTKSAHAPRPPPGAREGSGY